MPESAEQPSVPEPAVEPAVTAGEPAASAVDPTEIARAVAVEMADLPEQVGDFVDTVDMGDHVTDFRFVCGIKGYEGWQWSVTLYHDEEAGRWTVNESSLIPTDAALRPPAWVPWKDRLEPTDLSVTDSIGTDPQDPRIEEGFRKTEETSSEVGSADESDAADDATADADATDAVSDAAGEGGVGAEKAVDEGDEDGSTTSEEDVDDAVTEFDLSRRHVLSQLGRSQTAKRWYEGPHGPKSLSTKTADGNICANCGFFIQLKGELNVLFGVCANKWSPDDGRVVSVDHGCGEHSEINPPEPTHLWVQSKPAYDDLHIDVVAQAPREERDQVELIERLRESGIRVAKGVIVLRSQL
ncbi:DUF3027 domain-containing protein [Bifidobacterium aerophilum]|uniref:DUF3027 domain-containing protein n=1 Tax=Bifidobacterium aerophilum TaxID=1798155 RepID=A0A6N9Z881_9BIFI|nr:DUF3027 domain-containing protein [Bifidobacterium aerophilum]NEG90564.1 DUF3027 domain-containing protein [Bifidobacterium aerophilum]